AFQYPIHKTTHTIKIDGVLDDAAWQNTDVAKDFFMVLPMDTSRAQVKTEVRMTYNTDFLYFSAVCYEGTTGNYMVESLKRDFAFGRNDNFLVFIDPFNDQTNGFAFGTNAVGAQWDGMMYEGSKVDLSWDNKWFSVVKNEANKWILEAAIPFKTIRYKSDVTEWGINFSRNDLKTTEKSAWAPVPRQFPTASLAYTGTLVWDAPPPSPGANISVIPYALGGVTKDFVKKTDLSKRGEVGADVKIGLGPSLNLDVTVNPDFSQVEVDQQVTNLDRFELFFPERRQFFLENGDLFSNFGYSSLRPFFSRRIGLNAPIQFGARLSGKLTEKTRIGVMNMQTGKAAELGLPAQNFTVVAVQQKVQSRSNIGAFVINKQSLNYKYDAASGLPKYSDFNRNIGIEYNLASSNNAWTGKALLMKSFTPSVSGKDFVHAANLSYNSKAWSINWAHEYVGQNYNAEVGYVPRTGYIKVNPTVAYLFFPKKGPVLTHGPNLFSFTYFNESFKPTDNTTGVFYNLTFRSRSSFTMWTAMDYVQLLRPFDPTNSGKDTLARGTEHRWRSFGGEFISKPQSLFNYSFSWRYGGYYTEDGTRLNISTAWGYRFQPYVSLSMTTSYNDIRLPAPWGITKFWLVGPRLDVTMTDKLFFTAFAQYNEQQKNMNINTRLQWRYKPVSDLFIVYTDNYLPAPFSVKNRALVLKLTYWWNV
ncbi:MAG: carbohydrate binding family 9 domain-containing protein, partial [Saprospiraceae bacterium]|nr:carbohydrate binding family 9 domain-containing protein [Saprospiraceae bacterium]